MLITDTLTDLGYAAAEAQDGPSALAALESRTRFDLLVTDVGLPGMNGHPLAAVVRGTQPGIKVLFVTGYGESAVLIHGHREAGMHIMTKPFGMDALAERVGTLIRRPRP